MRQNSSISAQPPLSSAWDARTHADQFIAAPSSTGWFSLCALKAPACFIGLSARCVCVRAASAWECWNLMAPFELQTFAIWPMNLMGASAVITAIKMRRGMEFTLFNPNVRMVFAWVLPLWLPTAKFCHKFIYINKAYSTEGRNNAMI